MDRMRDTLARIAKQQTESRGGSSAAQGNDGATPPTPSTSDQAASAPAKPKALPARPLRSGATASRPPAADPTSVPRTPSASPRSPAATPGSTARVEGTPQTAPSQSTESTQPSRRVPPRVPPGVPPTSAPRRAPPVPSRSDVQPPSRTRLEADALDTDRILELPANRTKTREPRVGAARAASQPTRMHTPAGEAAPAPKADVPRISEVGPRGGDKTSRMQSLGDALQGVVARIEDRRQQWQATADNQGKAGREARESVRPAKPPARD